MPCPEGARAFRLLNTRPPLYSEGPGIPQTPSPQVPGGSRSLQAPECPYQEKRPSGPEKCAALKGRGFSRANAHPLFFRSQPARQSRAPGAPCPAFGTRDPTNSITPKFSPEGAGAFRLLNTRPPLCSEGAGAFRLLNTRIKKSGLSGPEKCAALKGRGFSRANTHTLSFRSEFTRQSRAPGAPSPAFGTRDSTISITPMPCPEGAGAFRLLNTRIKKSGLQARRNALL